MPSMIERHGPVPVKDIIIDRFQARKSKTGEGLEELAASIEKFGLLHPIGVCKSERHEGKWEVVFGQRRLLAHKLLKKKEIVAGIIDRSLAYEEGLALSANENLHVIPMIRKDIIDLCEELYKKYGTFKAVAEETKIPYGIVRKHVRYSALPSDLKKKVDDQKIKVDLAMRIQDAASAKGSYDEEEAAQLLSVVKKSDDALGKKILKLRQEHPTVPITKIVKKAEEPEKTLKVAITLGETLAGGLRGYADEALMDTNTAAEELIQEGLDKSGFLGD